MLFSLEMFALLSVIQECKHQNISKYNFLLCFKCLVTVNLSVYENRVLKEIFAPHRVQIRCGCRKLRNVMSLTRSTAKRNLLGKANRIWRYWELITISGEIVDTHGMLVGGYEGKAQVGSNAL
jgi:hypothetical protein